MDNLTLDYNEYIEIADGIYWVGFSDKGAGFHCNPYLIIDHDEAVLIDGGSRNDFGTVMLKILRTGTNPKNIKRLIYHHYDPDLCGNIPHLEALIGSGDLKILSHRENNIFIEYYAVKSPKLCIEDLGFIYEFSSGRRLEFIPTPYCHSTGSFVTYDRKTRTMFSSDIFGSYDTNWTLYSEITIECADCEPERVCPGTGRPCQVMGILDFHRRVMPATRALKYAIDKIERLDLAMIAPQHGSILSHEIAIRVVIDRLKSLKGVGIDCLLGDCKP